MIKIEKIVSKIQKVEKSIGDIRKNYFLKLKKIITSLKRSHFILKNHKKTQIPMLEDICTTGIKENASIITLIKLIGKKTTKHLSIGSKNYKKKFI